MRCVLVGNYGVSNLGDEALRDYFLRTFTDLSWTVVSARPRSKGEVPRLPFGLRSFFRPWWKTIGAIARADALVFGGGSLFTDIESAKAPAMWWMYAAFAHLFRVPLHMAFQGVGPFRTSFGSNISGWVFRHAASVSVRDEASLSRLQDFKIRVTPVLTFDPAFSIFSETKWQPLGRRLLLIPRSNSSDTFLRAAEKVMEGEWDDAVVLLMQPTEADRRHAARLKTMVKHVSVIAVEPTTVEEFLNHVSLSSFVLSQRFHGALAALAMGIPYEAVPQHEGDKLHALSSLTDTQSIKSLIAEGERALKGALS